MRPLEICRAGPLECRQPAPAARARLVCFAHAGGGPAAFLRWPQELAPDIEVWTVALPGRAALADEPFATAWEPLVAQIGAAVRAHVEPPMTLFGHSLGALLAYETARWLERRDAAAVARLFASSRAAPHIPATLDWPASNAELLDFVDGRYGGVPAVLREEPELRDHFVPILRADLELLAAYEWSPGPPLGCAITVLAGEADVTLEHSRLDEWGRHTRAAQELRLYPGGHFYLERELASVLDAVRGTTW